MRDRLLALSRTQKRILLVVHDLLVLNVAMWLAMAGRYGVVYVPPSLDVAVLLAAAPLLAIATFFYFGLYRLVTRYIGGMASGRIIGCVTLSVLAWSLLVLMAGLPGIPRSVPLIYLIFASAFILLSRHAVALVLKSAGIQLVRPRSERHSVLIYGAGPTGVQVLEALRRSGDLRAAGFIDDQASLWGQYVGGIKVYRPDKVGHIIERAAVKEIILALPETQRKMRREILQRLQQFPVQVKTMPSMEELASGKVTVNNLKPVEVDDLLGRDPVPPDQNLLQRNIRAKAVMVTGAGGSIGSELVRQIIRQQPKLLVLLELSEVALYTIETQVTDQLAASPAGTPRPKIVSVLGSILDDDLVRATIRRHGVQTIFHAAAYKHVPLVEANPVAGLHNNTFGTAVLAQAARDEGVERFVLISTDKAVRPTNVMGASKRLAELVLQAHAASEGCETVFTMVRFGNVLDSSGSVVRRFRAQIQAGGPITVTHPDVTRYFMSIPEAAELVLQAGAMATGGDVFVLEMGELVKIDALARAMVRLMGLEIRDESNPDGDIAIVYTGLRPGEKLYEELLLGENTMGTEHPRIMRNSEPHLPPEELQAQLDVLAAAMNKGDAETINAVLMRTVQGYSPPQGGLADIGRPAAAIAAPSRMLH